MYGLIVNKYLTLLISYRRCGQNISSEFTQLARIQSLRFLQCCICRYTDTLRTSCVDNVMTSFRRKSRTWRCCRRRVACSLRTVSSSLWSVSNSFARHDVIKQVVYILQILVVGGAIFSVIVYRIIMISIFFRLEEVSEYSSIITSVTAAVLNLIAIVLLNFVNVILNKLLLL